MLMAAAVDEAGVLAGAAAAVLVASRERVTMLREPRWATKVRVGLARRENMVFVC